MSGTDGALPAAVRLPWTFPAAALARDALALGPEDWQPHYNTTIYRGGWDTATLRAPVGGVGSFASFPDPSATGYAPTALVDRCPALAAVLAAIPAELQSARLLRLGPGADIREHRDPDLGHAYGEARLHVGVVAAERAELVVEGVAVPVAPGECWYIDASRRHRAANPGDGWRIHLVVDCLVGPDLDAALWAAAAGGGD